MANRLEMRTDDQIRSGFARFVPPSDALRDVFTSAVRQSWTAKPTEELGRRLEVLCACGPYPDDPFLAAELRFYRAQKAAWETYLSTSFACGLFEPPGGQDRRQRLASRDEEQFLGAIAECMTCWFLAGLHRLPLWPDPPGRNGRNLEMLVRAGGIEVGVEVKAPFRKPPQERVWSGDDSDKISQAMNIANRQFADDRANVLVLVPHLRRPLFSRRLDLLKAAYGQSKIFWPIDTQTGESGPTEVMFFPDGRFLNSTTPKGQLLKPDGLPAYRRISAIVCIEEIVVERFPFPDPRALLSDESRSELWSRWEKDRELHFSHKNKAWIDHNVLVMHNPHAYYPISQQVFSCYPQLIPVGDQMQWTDGEEVVV
jgi:hypothetical protein